MAQEKGIMTPLISIVIPVYNNEKYLPAAVDSVLTQCRTNIEIVIVDDGSTDKTPELVDHLAEKHPEIRAVHQKNQWIYAAMNRGIKEAKGKYIYILNSDDCLLPDTLKEIVEKAIRYEPDVIWTRIVGYDCVLQGEQLVKTPYYEDWGPEEDSYVCEIDALHESMVQVFFKRLAFNQANLYRKELLLKHPFRNDIYGADVIMNIDIADDVTSMVIMKKPVYQFFRYKTPEQNASIGKFYPYEHDMFNEFYQRFCRLFADWGLDPDSYKGAVGEIRIRQITREVRSHGFSNCPYTLSEKIKRILSVLPDQIVLQCAAESGRSEEMESRIMAGIGELLEKESLPEDDEMSFAKYLVQLRYGDRIEETQKDLFVRAVEHELNPAHIGKSFLNKYFEA